MFSFFHRSPEICIDFFTFDNLAYTNTPIIYANKSLPDWWKKIPKQKPIFGKFREFDHYHINKNEMTIKDCYGFIELYKKGFVMEHWADLSIKSNHNDFSFYYTNGNSPTTHPKEQMNNRFNNYHHLKLNSSWIFSEKSGIKFLFNSPIWSLDELGIIVLPGITTGNINNQMNVNIMFNKSEKEFEISLGQPICHIIPLTEKKIKIKNHLISHEEYDRIKIDSANVSIYGWRKVLQLRKRNKERGTCPFGFGDKL